MCRRSKQSILQRRHGDGQKTHGKISTSLIIRERQIKTIMRYHLTLARMAVIKRPKNNKGLGGCWEKETLLHRWWEYKYVPPLWQTLWIFLRKIKIELQFDPAIPLLGIFPELTMIWKDTCTLIFIAALYTIAKIWKPPKCPSTEDWIKKMWYIYTNDY